MSYANQSRDCSTPKGLVDDPGRARVAAAKTYHTVTACRKTRCDPGLPRCHPCERINARCEYFDVAKNRPISRTYITYLQSNVKRLHTMLMSYQQEERYVPDAEAMARTAGMIKFNDKDDYRFLGPSSGIAITRLVMEFAMQNSVNKKIRDVVPDITAREIKQKFDDESRKPTSKVYPLISSVAAPHLPTQELMDRLVDIYMVKAQYMLPLLHEPTFRNHVLAVYHGSSDPTLNFQLRLVIAISMQKLDTQYAGLADSYYLSALPYLESSVERRDLSTLQCLALMAQYSTLTPTRTASYWVVGLATRLSQELRLYEERTISEWPPGTQLNRLEVDMRRRLYWIISSLEYGLAHSLGRPSAFGTTVDHVDVGFFEPCDDRYITAAGLLPGHHPVMKKCIAIHFFRMRLLQAEIRRTLYLNKRDHPIDNGDPWFIHMQMKIDEWLRTCPKNDEGSGLNESWFHTKRNTMIVFLYRPSPQIPEPSDEAAIKCFDASIQNVETQSMQIACQSVDLTWIFTQILFMALNTILWALSYAEIRRQHPIDEVVVHLERALDAINHTSERWPGVQSALQLYGNLIDGCLRAYSRDPLYLIPSSALGQHAPSPFSQARSQSPVSHPDLAYSPQDQQSSRTELKGSPESVDLDQESLTQQHLHSPGQPSSASSDQQSHVVATSLSRLNPNPNSQDRESCDLFEPSSQASENRFPSVTSTLPLFDPIFAFDLPESEFSQYNAASTDSRAWLGSFGDEYSRYMHQASQASGQRMQSLSEQQQVELMTTLEQDQLPDVSDLMGDVAASYAGNEL